MGFSRERVKENIRGFIMRAARLRALDDDEQLFGSGLITSLFAMQLIEHIEREYPVFVEGEEMKIETFRSVSAVSEYIEGKLARGGGIEPIEKGSHDAPRAVARTAGTP